MRILTYKEIDRAQWKRLVQESETGTWFQSPEAYDFFATQKDIMEPFVVGVEAYPQPLPERKGVLRAVCVGYVTKEKSAIKQYFTRRAIILGGPCLADDCTDEEVFTLMQAVRKQLQSQAIYIESRNFNDYSRWKEAFEAAGFEYRPHLNFHVDCREEKVMWERLSENRRRQIRKADAVVEIIENKNIQNTADAAINREKEKCGDSACCGQHGLSVSADSVIVSELPLQTHPIPSDSVQSTESSPYKNATSSYENEKNEREIREWYGILERLYRTKVKTPLWPVEFFLEAYRQGVGKFMLVRHEGKIIGGSMVVTDGKAVYEWFECGLNTEYKEQYPSVMATWAGMSYAAEYACARYDMMGAGKPAIPYGVRDFKAEFGGELVEHGRFLCVTKPLLYQVGKLGVRILKCLK